MSRLNSATPRKALIVTALAGFIRSFLMPDIATLQSMGFEVHCAANANHAGANDVVEFLESRGVIYHQVDFFFEQARLQRYAYCLWAAKEACRL